MKLLMLLAAMIIPPIQVMAESITLEQVIQESLQKNTSLFRVQREYEDKLATATGVELLDNPEINLDAIRQSSNKSSNNVIGTGLEITQPLKFSQISGARHRYATALSSVANAEKKYELLKVINEATVLYTQTWILSERKKIYENYADDAEKMKKLVNESAGQGQTSPAASHLFSADAAKLRVDANAVEAELRQIHTNLARLTGHSYQVAQLQRPSFLAVPQDTEKLLTFARAQSNLRNIVKNRIHAAEIRLKVAKQDGALPEIAPRLIYSNNSNGNQDSYGLGITLRIPLWNQNDAERKRANAELHQAISESDFFNQLPQKDMINELQQSATILQSRADSYFDSILPRYRKSYELSRNMFREGQTNALAVWQVREKLLNSENEALDALAETVNARIALELELGGKLEEIK